MTLDAARRVRAPNWLGDAVLALPAMAALRRQFRDAHLAVAAVPGSRADVPGADGGSSRCRDRALGRRASGDRGAGGRRLRPGRALSEFVSIGLDPAARARPRPLGLRRRRCAAGCSRAGARQSGRAACSTTPNTSGGSSGDSTWPAATEPPALEASLQSVERADALLAQHGLHDRNATLIGFAPGAAYGEAKQWPPDRVAAVAARLVRERGATCLLVGATARPRGRPCDRILASCARARRRAARPRFRRPHVARHARGHRGPVPRLRVERFGRDAHGGGARPARRRDLRVHRRTGHAARRGARGDRGARVLPSVPASRLSDRPSLHEAHLR